MQYEYKIVLMPHTKSQQEGILNQFGEEGWEFVGISDNYAYFKRKFVSKL